MVVDISQSPAFPGRRRHIKIHQKSPTFFTAKSRGKLVEKIHTSFLEGRQGNKLPKMITPRSKSITRPKKSEVAFFARNALKSVLSLTKSPFSRTFGGCKSLSELRKTILRELFLSLNNCLPRVHNINVVCLAKEGFQTT